MNAARPPEWLERLIALLIPAARREETLGDLHERYSSPGSYVANALQLIFVVIWMEVRRSTDVSTVALQAGALFICFAGSAVWLRTGAVALADVVWPALAMQLAFVLASAYVSTRTVRGRFECGLFAGAIAYSLEPQTCTAVGAALSLVVLCCTRARNRLRNSAHKVIPMQSSHSEERTRAFAQKVRRGTITQFLTGSLLLLFASPAFVAGRRADHACGAAILALTAFIFFQTHRRWSAMRRAENYRARLARHQADLRSMWWWFVLPFLGGMLLFALRLPLRYLDGLEALMKVAPFTTMAIVWSIWMVFFTEREAQKVQREMDEIDRAGT